MYSAKPLYWLVYNTGFLREKEHFFLCSKGVQCMFIPFVFNDKVWPISLCLFLSAESMIAQVEHSQYMKARQIVSYFCRPVHCLLEKKI